MRKGYTRFQTKTEQKPYLMRAAHTHLYGLYKGEPPPPGPWISSDRTWRGWSKDFFEFKFSIPGFFGVPAYPGRVVLRIKSTKHVFKNFAFRVISFNVFWKFLRLGNTAWNFDGVRLFDFEWWVRGGWGGVGADYSRLGAYYLFHPLGWALSRGGR